MPSPLSKRHYDDLAAAIKASNEATAKASAINLPGRPVRLPWTLPEVNTLAGFLASNNPRFQPYRFVAACGFGE
jgi:hypothetical protein